MYAKWTDGKLNFYSRDFYKTSYTFDVVDGQVCYSLDEFYFIPIDIRYAKESPEYHQQWFHSNFISVLTCYIVDFDFPEKILNWNFKAKTERNRVNLLDLSLDKGLPLVKVTQGKPIDYGYGDYFPPNFDIVDYLHEFPKDFIQMYSEMLNKHAIFDYKDKVQSFVFDYMYTKLYEDFNEEGSKI